MHSDHRSVADLGFDLRGGAWTLSKVYFKNVSRVKGLKKMKKFSVWSIKKTWV